MLLIKEILALCIFIVSP